MLLAINRRAEPPPLPSVLSISSCTEAGKASTTYSTSYSIRICVNSRSGIQIDSYLAVCLETSWRSQYTRAVLSIFAEIHSTHIIFFSLSYSWAPNPVH